MLNIQEPQSLFTLWLAQFGVVNRTIGKIIKLGIILFLPYFVLAGILFALKPTQIAILVLAGIVFALYTLFITVGSPLMLMRIFTADVENQPESTGQTITRCVLPAIYVIIYQILFSICSFLISMVGNFTRSAIVAGLLNLIFSLCVTVRLVYTGMAIAVRDKGPIEGAAHSWQLSSGTGYMRTLGMCFMSIVLPVLVVLGLLLLAYGLYVGIPLYIPNSFDIANLSPMWFVAGGLLLVLMVFFGLCMSAFPVLVFLNMDNCLYQDEWTTPAANLVADTPSADDVNVWPTPGKKTAAAPEQELEDLTVQRSSVHSAGHESMQAHLDQVYKPKKQEFIQYQDEDRMPTILFDDEMAKQLEENRKMFTSQNGESKPGAHNPQDDGPSSIKMSK